MALKYLCRQGIAMVGEVAGEDCCQVQIAPLLTGQHHDTLADTACYPACHVKGIIIRSLNKKRYAREVYPTFLRERLHRIDDTIMAHRTLEDIQRHRPCRMIESLLTATISQMRQQVAERCILDSYDKSIGLVRQGMQVVGSTGPDKLCQLSG